MKNNTVFLILLLSVALCLVCEEARSQSQAQAEASDGTELTGFVRDNLVIPIQSYEDSVIKISNKQVVIDGYWEFKDETGQVLEEPIILSQPAGLTDKLLLALRRPGTAEVSVTEGGKETVYMIDVQARFEENNIEKELESAIKKFVADPGLEVSVLPPQAALVGANLNRAFGEETASEILAPRGETAGNAATDIAGAADFRPTIILTGEVENDLVLSRAESIARAYTTNVINLVSVRNPLQVRINVKIIRLSYSKDSNIGLQHRSAAGVVADPQGAGSTAGFGLGFQSSAPFFETGNNGDLPIFGTNIPGNIGTTVNLAAVDAEAELLQEPTLTVLNGEAAQVRVGQVVFVPGETVFDENGNAITSVEERVVGVNLLMTPIVEEEETYRPDADGELPWQSISTQSSSQGRNPDNAQIQTVNTIDENGVIRMAIQPSITSIGPNTNTNGPFNGSFLTNVVETRVAIRHGESLVLGGLFDSQTRKSMEKIPFVADIPILGELFKNRGKNDTKTELVFVLTPRVMGIDDIDAKANVGARLPKMQEMALREGIATKPTRISANDILVRPHETVDFVSTVPEPLLLRNNESRPSEEDSGSEPAPAVPPTFQDGGIQLTPRTDEGL